MYLKKNETVSQRKIWRKISRRYNVPIDRNTEKSQLCCEELVHSGLAEHSSVAGFSKVLVGLLSVGRSDDNNNASQALPSAIKHAKLCFGLANAIRVSCGEKNGDNRVLAPGALPVKSTLKVHAVSCGGRAASAIEGCVEETLSAFLAAVALDVLPTSNSPRYIPSVGDKISFVLKHITNDESRHASLAWYTVRWCLEEERKRLKGEKGDVYRSVYEAFQKAFRNVDKDGLEEDEDFSHDDSMWPYRMMSNRTERFVGKRILEMF